MLASIIIVSYGQRELTEQCLRSLQRCLGDRLGVDWELVLVDNGSPDDSAELLRSWSDRATVLLLEENRNFAGGCNAGAAAARGQVLVFLNNDTEVTPGALETIVEQTLEPGVAIAGCRLLFPRGTIQHAGVAFLRGTALGGAAMGQHIFHDQDQDLAMARGVYELDCVTAACMAVRATTFREVEGFDEGFKNGIEDVDLCLRVRLTGERIVYRGDATVIHYEGASRGRGQQLWATPAKMEMMRHNDEYFVARWAEHLDQDDDVAALLWDASLENAPPKRLSRTAELIVFGQPGGVGPAADEARAFLAAFDALGYYPAAADTPHPTVIPRLGGEMAALLHRAQLRAPVPSASWVFVPAGEHDRHTVRPESIVRLARPRAALALDDAGAIWAASPAVASAVIDDGIPAGRVRVVAPPIPAASIGEGGGGVLAVLPAHEPRAARAILSSLRSLPAGVEIRLVPTVRSRGLAEEITSVLPRAELLGPCSDEARFASLAATADAVIALDPSDRFERRALVAAGVGTAPITRDPAGPAAAVLGAHIAADESALASTLGDLLSGSAGERHARAQLVENSCRGQDLSVRDVNDVAMPC